MSLKWSTISSPVPLIRDCLSRYVIGSEHVHLLYYSETRWLYRGNVLRRVYELQSEISVLLKEKNHKLAGIFNNIEWLSRLCYLVDVFEHLNF